MLGGHNPVHDDCGGSSFPEKFRGVSDGSASSSEPPDIVDPNFTARSSTAIDLSMQPPQPNVESTGTSVSILLLSCTDCLKKVMSLSVWVVESGTCN